MTNERNKVKTHFIDAFGRLSQVRESNLGISYDTFYTYDAADQLVQVQNSQGHLTKMEYDRLGRKTAMCDPNMGTDPTGVGVCTAAPPTPGAWVYTYNKAGDMLTQTDAKNQKLCFTYDESGRPTSKSQGTSCTTLLASFTYDITTITATDFPKGRLTQVIDSPSNVTTRFAYDELGRNSKSQRVILGVTHEMAQTYDALDRIKQETFPDPDTVDYTYDGPWLKSVTGYINDILYNGRGQKTSLTYANNVTTTFTYFDQPADARKFFRVKRRTTTNSLQDLQYTYDDTGNLTSITDSIWTGTRTVLGYDDLNRLTDAQGTFGPLSNNLPTPTSCIYVYNSIGNLTDKCGIAFTYNDATGKHPSAVTFNPATGKTYQYDDNGNMIARGNQTLTWDFENRVTSVSIGGSTTSMEYDYTGMRVKKWAPGAALTQYPFKGYEIDPGGTITKFIKIGIETFASKKTPPSGQGLPNKHFYHNDHLGGVNVLSSEAGAKEQLTEYDPWGSVSRNEGVRQERHPP
jgi:YD repeat-containing protein